MDKIEHIGIAVKNLDASNKLYEKLLGKPHYKIEEVLSEGVKTSFFEVGPNKIELLEATKPDSPIAKFLEKKGEGIHHIAFAVDDIEKEMARIEKEGFVLLNKIPKQGADNKLVAFVHPKTAGGVLVELCQENNNKQ
ncbi:methylmalonyl-CoA epimerase [uncultured Dokdonia sp.]|uniref:methylmalonyl-CoA epimerase n=1 Tax=uncultured Dokdonia sp. TaxID=575653 RepID=UPI002623EB81|nr:methylmalonyl-CoA epimerase [uncultured Dokdonia sp.]